MAPTNEHLTRRRGTGSGRPYGDANTNAGVNRNRPAAARDAYRARILRHRPFRAERARAPVNATSGLSLASRMTYGRERGMFGRGVTLRPHLQYGLRLQDRITRADDNVTAGSGGGDSGGSESMANLQVNHRAQAKDMRAAPTNDGIDINLDSNNDNDDTTYDDSQLGANNGLSQGPLLVGAQPTQLADAQTPLSPPFRATRPAQTARPIGMMNEPIAHQPININDEGGLPNAKRPVNTYRGKDPVKRLVQNPKLRAILSDKPIPTERKKHKDERMELRIGVSKVLK